MNFLGDDATLGEPVDLGVCVVLELIELLRIEAHAIVHNDKILVFHPIADLSVGLARTAFFWVALLEDCE